LQRYIEEDERRLEDVALVVPALSGFPRRASSRSRASAAGADRLVLEAVARWVFAQLPTPLEGGREPHRSRTDTRPSG
jgi:hypothetical protein